MSSQFKVLKHRLRCQIELTHEWRRADKTALELQAKIYEVQIEVLTKGVAELRRLVYIGLGIVLCLNLAVLVWKHD